MGDRTMLEGIMAGFECGTQLRRNGRRHDFVQATGHDRWAELDYALLKDIGMTAARDGLRWHLIERRPGRYDWASFRRQFDAARRNEITVVWDLLHYGWPRWLDPLSDDFEPRFVAFAAEAASQIGPGGHYTPINEISFLAWGGGEVGYLQPFRRDCAPELKRIYCRAAITAIRAIRAVDPAAMIYTSEPLIHVVPEPNTAAQRWNVKQLLAAQHEAALMVLGEINPELGGEPGLIDVIGINHYPHNQFDSRRRMMPFDDPRRRALSDMLIEVQRLYRKPLIISETGAENDDRADWLRHVCSEARLANASDAHIRAVCLYPILNHLGWDDDRYCAHGLFCGIDAERAIYQPLADQIERERMLGLGFRNEVFTPAE